MNNRGFKSRPKAPGSAGRTASGGVFKRGGGIGASSPGSGGGYFKRGMIGGSGGSGSSGGSGNPFGSMMRSGGSRGCSLKGVLLIAIVVIILLFVVKCSSSGDVEESGGYMDSLSNVTDLGQASYEGNLNSQAGAAGFVSNNDISAETGIKGLRTRRTKIKGNGEDTVTIMLYMCGADLESKYGMASKDLLEIINANIADNVQIIVETGGAKKWQTKGISAKTNQRFRITSTGLQEIKTKLGRRSMTDPATLTSFVKFCAKKYPADRYALIMWDHGGGSISGFGYDEFSGRDSMTISEMNKALTDAGVKFDFVGFDACLMATLETAYMLNYHSDYMIASEEIEPGLGWYYTGFISAISENTSIPTVQIGTRLIDDYVSKCYQNDPSDAATLSLIDLVALNNAVDPALSVFSASTTSILKSDDYKIISDARSRSREFSDNSLDQVDLMDFANRVNTKESQALVSALKECIRYNKTSKNITNANGLSVYFPFDELRSMPSMLSTYEQLGMESSYSKLVKRFGNLVLGGKITSSGGTSAFPALTGGSYSGGLLSGAFTSFLAGGDFSGFIGSQTDSSWVDTNYLESMSECYETNCFDTELLTLTEHGDETVLSMEDSEWEKISDIQLNVFVDDGGGYIDLGMDNYFEFTEDGDLLIDYDMTWPAINDHVVSYYMECCEQYGEEMKITGRVPAMLNGQRVDIIVVWNTAYGYNGTVLGARPVEQEADTIPKGLIDIVDGDVIDFLCDYYTYDERFDDSYYLGSQLVVENGLAVTDVNIGDRNCLITYRLKDTYGNCYWTPAVKNH